MDFEDFDWDAGNRGKCQSHGLSIAEIESVFARPILVLPDRENPQGEKRFRAIGTAASGSKVFIVFTVRTGAIRPISARFMHKREIETYDKTYPDV